MNVIAQIESEELSRLDKNHPNFFAGDTVDVKSWVVEGKNRRLQGFEGVVIAKSNKGLNSSFIVMRTSSGEMFERTYQLHSPLIESITVKRHARVRRAKLYYLRERSGRSARIKERIGAKRLIKPK